MAGFRCFRNHHRREREYPSSICQPSRPTRTLATGATSTLEQTTRAETIDLRDIADPERQLIQVIFDAFAEAAAWPLVGDLQHQLDRDGEELDVVAVGKQIPRVLGIIDATGYQGRAQLTIHGLSLCRGSEAVLNALLCLVRQEHDRWLALGMGSSLTSAELSSACRLDETQLRCLRALMDGLPGWQGISGGPESPWSVQMSMDIRRFRDVWTVEELLAAVPLPGYPDATWPFVSRPRTEAGGRLRRAVFISCAESYKSTLAYPLRDLLEANDVRAFIVSDLPRRGTAWTAEEKVKAYLDEADAMIAIATPDLQDKRGRAHPRTNIADEIGRARGMANLKDRVCVVKERTTLLPSNIAPVYELLDLADPSPMFAAVLAQLREWGFEIADPPRNARPPTVSPETSVGVAMLEGLAVDNPARTRRQVLQWLTARPGAEQAQLVGMMVSVALDAPRWEDRSVAGHVLESMAVIDASLLRESLLDELSRHPDTSVRSSVSVILFDRAVRSPGLVPLSLVARLADSTGSDGLDVSWYVYTPARHCLAQLALTREEVWDVVRQMASSPSTEMRSGAAGIMREVVHEKPTAVPPDLLTALSHDEDSGVRRAIAATRKAVRGVRKGQRRTAYTPFSPF